MCFWGRRRESGFEKGGEEGRRPFNESMGKRAAGNK